MLKSKLEWDDNNYQVGLFTFYKNNDSCSTPLRNNPEKKTKGKNKFFKVKRKITQKLDRNNKKYQTQYMQWDLEKSKKGKERHESPFLRANTSEKKTLVKHQLEQHEKPIQEMLTNRTFLHQRTKNASKSQMTIKKKNVNEGFKYDLSRDRTRRFIYRGETQRSNAKSYNLVQKMPEINNDEDQQNPNNKTKGREVKIKFKPQLNLYSNFVQLLVQKRKRQLNQRKDQKGFHNFHQTLQNKQVKNSLLLNYCASKIKTDQH